MKLMRFSLFPVLALFILGFTAVGGDPAFRLRIQGQVFGATDGQPIPNARVLIWGVHTYFGPILEAEHVTDVDGRFDLTVVTQQPTCIAYVYYDDPSTVGFDTLPAIEKMNSSVGIQKFSLILYPASTVILEGPLRLIDSSSTINDYRCQVLDPMSGELICVGAFELIYGTKSNAQNHYLGIEPNIIIVPAGTPFELRLIPSYSTETLPMVGWPWQYQSATAVVARDISIKGEGGFVMERGEVLRLDLRKFTVSSDLLVVESLTQSISQTLRTREEQGFYMLSEKGDIARVKELAESSSKKLSKGLVEDAYIDAKQAYLCARDLRSKIFLMESEASASLKGLVAYIALASFAASYIFFEHWFRRMLSSTFIYAVLLLYIYAIHPGRNFISPGSFVAVSLFTVMAIFLVVLVLPKLAGESKILEEAPFLSVLGSLFSMAKRNLLRRRLRFTLTITSILTLSMSFVALTSFSTGYGLNYSLVEWVRTQRRGLVVQEPPYTPSLPLLKGRFYEVIDDVADWVKRREEVISVARLAESYPSLEPYGFVGNQPIHGILGIEPSAEPLLPEIEDCIVEGDFPAEDGEAVLVSDQALRESSGSIGDIITIGEVRLRITGAFDRRLIDIKDLNGELLIPNTQVDLTEGGGAPTIVVTPCNHEAVIVTSLNQALKMHKDVRVSRVAANLGDGVDPKRLAKSLALEREVMVWASTGGGVYLAHLGGYVEASGFHILVPLIIVILNVIVTMLNAMYERRREIAVLSSVGLNPSHIAGMFAAEASFIGIFGGGFGYLTGIGLYPLMASLSFAPLVRQKISLVWSFGAMGIAVAATAIGVILALKWSVVSTPSLERKWALEGRPRGYSEPWIIPIPIKVRADDVGDFIAFMKRSLVEYIDRSSYPNILCLNEGMTHDRGRAIRTLSFWYREGDTGPGGSSASCVLEIFDRAGDAFSRVVLQSFGIEGDIRRSGKFVRGLALKWNLHTPQKD